MSTDNRTNIMDEVRQIPMQVLGYAKDTLTPESAWSEEESKERADNRKVYINAMNAIMNRYKGKDDPAWEAEQGKIDLDTIKKYQKQLKGDLEISYDELTWNPKFLQDARIMFKSENGYDFRESDVKLKNYVFSKFNQVEQNIGVTAGNLVFDNMFYKNFDDKGLQATKNAYKTFSEVDWTGKGSRDFGSQVIDFVGNTALDPAMYGTGYTVGWLAKGARLLGKKAFTKQMTDNMASLIGMSTYTGSLAAAQSSNIQNVQKDLGIIDEVSGTQIVASAVLGAAIPPALKVGGMALSKSSDAINKQFGFNIPIISKDVNSVVGNMQRAAKKPLFTAYGRNVTSLEKEGGTVKGKEAAFIGTIKNVEREIIEKNSTQTASKDFYTALTDDVINPMNETIQRGYNNLSYNNMSAAGMNKIKIQVKELLDKNSDNPSFAMQGELKALYDLLVPTEKIAQNKAKIKTYKKDLVDHEAALVAHKKEVELIKKKNSAITRKNANEPFDFENNVARNQQPLFEIPKAPIKPKDPGIKNPVTDALLTGDRVDAVFRQLRAQVYNSQDGFFNQGNFLTSEAYKKLYSILKSEQRSSLSTNGDKLAWDALQTATGDFKNALHNLPLGKKFEKILHYNKLANNARTSGSTGNATAFDLQAQEESGNLLNYIIDNKNSLNHLKQFEGVLSNIDARTANVVNARAGGQIAVTQKQMEIAFTKKNFEQFPELSKIEGVDNKVTRSEFIQSYAQEYVKKANGTDGSYNPLLGIIKSSLARKLEVEGVESISRILIRDDGFELIGYMFPQMKDDLLNIKKLGQYLDKHVSPKHSQSVIVNMTLARTAQDLGTALASQEAGAGAVLATFTGLQRWRNLVSNPVFQESMAAAINNNGRLSTKTQLKLEQRLGFDAEAIRTLQDGISNIMLVSRPAIKNQENLKRKAKRMVE